MALKVIDGKLTNRHHRYWPRSLYTERPPARIDVEIAKRFRSLPCESDQIEIAQHNRLHERYDPPEVPSQSVMEAHLRRHELQLCICFREKPAAIVVTPPQPNRKRGRMKKTTRRTGSPRYGRPRMAFAR